MTTTGIADLKARLSEYLAKVRTGDEVVITDRGTPIARIVPLTKAGSEWRDLERAGLLRRPARSMDEDFLARSRPGDPEASVRQALAEEREGGW